MQNFIAVSIAVGSLRDTATVAENGLLLQDSSYVLLQDSSTLLLNA